MLKRSLLLPILITSLLMLFDIFACQKPGKQENEISSEMSKSDLMEANKQVVARYVDRFNAGDMQGLKDLFAEDALIYGVLGWGKVEDVLPIWKQLVDGLAMQLTI